MNKRLLTLALVAAGSVFLAVTSFVVFTLAGGNGGCPTMEALGSYRPPEASRVYAADGSVVADLSPQRRIVVELDDVPAIVRDGVVAVEDRRFYRHHGIDYRGVARAVWRNLSTLSVSEGFSTITMQLVRSVFPERLPLSRRFSRKVCEVHLARHIESRAPKDEILEMYLNQIYFGAGLYGIEAAARGYFASTARALRPEEAALLVGLVQSPSRYNPRRNPMAAIQRRNVVLDVMAREGVLTREEAERAKAEPLWLAAPEEAAGSAPYFVAAVRSEVRERFGPDADVRGLRVFTGLDPHIQRAADRALVEQVERIEAGAYGRYPHAVPSDGTAPDEPVLQGMIVVMDPHTGEIRAVTGGRDFSTSQFNRAFQARRQPGSAFKPIVYAAAMEQGLPVTARVATGPVSVSTRGSPTWRPGDHVADTVETLSVRNAIAVSSNHAAVRVGRWVGEDRVASLGRALGLSTPIPPYPSIHLGAAEVIPAELVAAFAAFGNGGYRIEPTLIRRVEDRRGRVVWRAPSPREQVLDPGVAFITLTLLEGVVNHGTGRVIRDLGFWLPAAGKTGTTNEGRDAWFIGMTPDLVAGVWLGLDQPRRIMAGASGGRLAAPVWAEMMTRVYEDRTVPTPWTPPLEVVAAQIDVATGYLATDACPRENVRVEYFLIGTEPREPCPLHPGGGLFDRLWRRVRKVF